MIRSGYHRKMVAASIDEQVGDSLIENCPNLVFVDVDTGCDYSNQKQIGGSHYQTTIQPWDYTVANNLDYFQGTIIKYITRCWSKNGIEDLEKAAHFLEKYIELAKAGKLHRG